MQLEELRGRLEQLNKAIEDTTQSIFILRGHKGEVEFQISQLVQKAAEEAQNSVDNSSDIAVES